MSNMNLEGARGPRRRFLMTPLTRSEDPGQASEERQDQDIPRPQNPPQEPPQDSLQDPPQDPPLRDVDKRLVDFLLSYTIVSDECSPPMRTYLRGLLVGDDEHEIRMRLDRGLRSQYMHDIGVGQHLRDFLLDYKIANSLWPGARRSSSGRHEPMAPGDADATESASRDAEQRHWSNRITQVFGAVSPGTTRVDELEENRHAKPDRPEQDMIDDVVRLMRDKFKHDSSQGPSPAPAYGDIWRSASEGATSLPEDVEEDLNDMKVEFDAQTGTIMLSQPDAGEDERVGLRLEGEGWVVEDVQIERSPRAPTAQQAGTASASTTAHEKYPQTQRMKVTPTEPTVRGAFWSMYNSLAESDPKQARSLLNLIRIKIEDFLKNTHEGRMADNTMRTSSSRTTQPTTQRTQAPRGAQEKPAFKPVLKDGPEWKLDSWYRGSRQPPLGVRLENILNFLSDEDMDRCVNFEECYKEIGYYLNWLWEMDAAEQLHNASDDIRRMFYDAVCKMLVHKSFEDHHYAPSKIADGPPPKVPRPSARLDWTNVKKNLLLPAAEAIGPGTSSYHKVYTRRTFPRPNKTVNTMLEEETQGIEDPQAREDEERRILEPFIEHTWKFWNEPVEDQRAGVVDYENLAVIESRAFERYSRRMPAWVKGQRLPRNEPRFLPDNKRILPNDPTSWARERGARRAGLMQLLTSFQSTEQAVAGPDRSLVMVPTPAAHELQVRKQTDGLQWKPPHVSAAELPPQLEVMPYTYWWRIYAQELRWVRYQAMLDVEQKFSDGRRWVTLPRNLICSGPFIWRMVDPDVQKLQDVLEEARTTARLLQLAVKREPRPLLVDAVDYMQRAIDGEFPNGQPPRELRLRKDEWYSGGERRQPRFTTGDDFKWLQFLGSECANAQNYSGFVYPSKYLSHEYKLYQVFTKRLHKLMDDKGPSALFLEQKTRVTVEELLSRMNAGCHGPVKKVVFKPYDACHFLDRLSKSGHVRFELDLACYGVVQRPNIELFPEHRVRWPSELNRIDAELPQYPFDIEGYHHLVERGRKAANLKTPDVDKGSEIYNFFVNLAFRLGWTLHSLSHEKERWQAPHRLPLETQVLRDAVQKFDQAAMAAGSSEKDFPQQTRRREDMFTTLQELVRRANPGDWSADMTRGEAVAMIRNRITEEGEANLGLLAPARRKEYFAQGKTQIAYVPDVSWEWASVRVRGHRRQFWDMNRWAPHDDYLSDHWKDVRARDGILDWTQCYNPRVYDKTPQAFKRPKLRPYTYGDKVKFKPGRAIYPIGDTKRQREAVEDYMTDVAARAMGIQPRKRTWSQRLSGLNPFSGPLPGPAEQRRDGDVWLPRVDPRAVPTSFDPEAFLQAIEQRRAEEGGTARGPENQDREDRNLVRPIFGLPRLGSDAERVDSDDEALPYTTMQDDMGSGTTREPNWGRSGGSSGRDTLDFGRIGGFRAMSTSNLGEARQAKRARIIEELDSSTDSDSDDFAGWTSDPARMTMSGGAGPGSSERRRPVTPESESSSSS